MKLNKLISKISTFRALTTTIILVGVLIFSAIVGCKKENTETNPNLNSASIRSESTLQVERGMLKFSSYKAAHDFVNGLEVKEQNSELMGNAYTQLGVDINAETLPNLTDHPICLLQDQSLSFISKRKAEEQIINNALNSGQEIFSIISNPYWKTVLNSEGSVLLGNRIYRFFDNNGIVIVLNNDWDTYYAKVQGKSFEQIREDYNLIVTSESSDEWNNYFQLDENSNVVSEKMVNIPRFFFQETVNGRQRVINKSLIETTNSSNTFSWLYSDGTQSIGQSPSRELSQGENINVKVNNGSGEETPTIFLSPAIICPDYFTITKLSNNQFKFEDPSVPLTSYLKMRWTFSDGFVSAWGANPLTRTITSNVTVTCEYWLKDPEQPHCFRSKPVTVKCGDPKEGNRTISSSNWGGSGKPIKIEATLWVKNNEVGCSSKNFGRKFGIWVPLNLAFNTNGVRIDIDGTYLHDPNCTKKTVKQENILPGGNNSSIDLKIPDAGQNFADPGKLSSGHRIRILPGDWFGIGYGTPRLVLN